jgi:hypothetical protein
MTVHFPELSAETVEERIRWARRRGYASWIWPDVPVENWRSAARAITDVVRKVLAGETGVVLACDDPRAASLAGYTSGAGPLLGYWIESRVVQTSEEMAAVFQLHLAHNRERMAELSRIAKEAVSKLAKAGVRPLVVKSMHTAFCYFPEPGARTASDIDIVVSMEQIPAAESVFAELGYNRIFRFGSPYSCDWVLPSAPRAPRTLMYVHRSDPWGFDVQGTLNRRLPTGVQMRLDAVYRPGEAEAWKLSGDGAALPQPLLALHLAAHVSEALMNATLQRLVELIFVIRTDVAAGRLRWQEFLEAADAIGGRRFVYPALMLCEKLAPDTIPRGVLEACAADAPGNLRALMKRLSIEDAQPLGKHSLRERFMWAGNWTKRFQQLAGEFALDGRQQPLGRTLYSVGTKLWALRRGRCTA